MDQFSDDFISYENFADIKFDTLLDPNFSLTSPFSESTDSFFPDLFPKTIQNLLETNELPRQDSSEFSSVPSVKKSKPFQIIKSKKSQLVERLDYSDPLPGLSPISNETVQETKISSKSKRIAKVEKAKERAIAKQNNEEWIESVDVKYIPEGYGDPMLDTKTQRKMLKVIKNRISAQNSRDRKKQYIEQLEEIRDNYAEENQTLKQEKDILLERIEKLQADYDSVLKENELLKAGSTINMNYQCGNIKYQCGSTVEFDSNNTDATTEISEKISSPELQPASAENSGHYSIFSVAIAALLCLLFIITGGQFGEFPMKVIENIRTPTIIRLSKNLLSELNVSAFTEEVELSLKEFNFGDMPILNRIKPLMEEFEKFHEAVSQSSDNVNRPAVSLSQAGSGLVNGLTGFDGSREEKVATLFAPAAFEISKTKPKMELETENSAHVESVQGVDLEKAEYLQLLVPKYTVGKLGVSSDSDEMRSISGCSRFGEENSLVEVWCKVLARRNTAISL